MDAPSSISSNPHISLMKDELPIQFLDVWAGYKPKRTTRRICIALTMALVLGALLALVFGDQLISPSCSIRSNVKPCLHDDATPAVTTVELNHTGALHEGKRN